MAQDDKERSMSEILASIRKIVNDEEETRAVAEEVRRKDETAAGGEVFVLTGDMRAAAGGRAVVDEEPLALSAADMSAPGVSPDFPAAGLSEEEVEDIVRRVVREELQGPIGHQISRKVKQLIRDEVARALAEEEEDFL